MDYPFWDVGIGYGWLMAAIAVFHVFISHFAIGGGLYLVVTEIWARRKGDTVRLAFLEKVSKFFVLTSLVMGALTGVAIWFIIGLLNPAATEALIHLFVWFWATEWTFFVVEIAAAIIYLYGWKTMSPKNHVRVGWIYFVSAWLSLFAINGIISFMLTPGDWITTANIWDGFFNPTFWSSLVFRTGICIMLAGIYTMMIASREKDGAARGSLVRYNAWWGVAGLAVMLPTLSWFWQAIPEAMTRTIVETMPTTAQYFQATGWWAWLLGALIVVFGLILPRRMPFFISLIIMAVGLTWFGQWEFFRESARKPYAIGQYMYGNGIEVAKADSYAEAGLRPAMAYRTGDDGADLFRRYCRSCHTIGNYKALKNTFDGTDPEFVKQIVMGMSAMRGNMPPWLGTEEEALLIGEHIWSQVDQRKFSDVYADSETPLDAKVYEIRCGRCHEVGGYNDKRESFDGMTREEIEDMLNDAGYYADEMPDFTGDSEEREALITYLLKLANGEEN